MVTVLLLLVTLVGTTDSSAETLGASVFPVTVGDVLAALVAKVGSPALVGEVDGSTVGMSEASTRDETGALGSE